MADPGQPVWIAVPSPQGGGWSEVCLVPHGGITRGRIMELEQRAFHVLHGSDSLEKYWRAVGAGYMSEDNAAPGPMGVQKTCLPCH